MQRREFLLGSLAILGAGALLEAMEIKPLPATATVKEALFINCLQRTQTQQLLKEYLMVALGSNYKDPKKNLPVDVENYDRRFGQLYDFFHAKIQDPEVLKKLEKARNLWQESRKMLLAPPSKENALKLEENFYEMIHLLGATKILGKKSFKQVGLTGGMCRDPLFMANLYLMKIWGVDNPKYDEEMHHHMTHFRKNLAELKAFERNTPEIKKHLEQAGKAFMFFEFMHKNGKIKIPTLISQKADDIFLEIRTIKKLYGAMA